MDASYACSATLVAPKGDRRCGLNAERLTRANCVQCLRRSSSHRKLRSCVTTVDYVKYHAHVFEPNASQVFEEEKCHNCAEGEGANRCVRGGLLQL